VPGPYVLRGLAGRHPAGSQEKVVGLIEVHVDGVPAKIVGEDGDPAAAPDGTQ
jgi:hypothetical protein